ncbi:hypothetical protein [Bradyrhizobium liaoningense]|uniref:hypothetical protein n=1 Tax=Bradyrhizobium sp. SMVTL-02 TaxID=3395917 RepID=UPI000AFE54E1
MSALEPAVFLAKSVADRVLVEVINTPLVFSPRRAFLPSRIAGLLQRHEGGDNSN